jgi:uncharacterized protein DUF2634
MADELESVEQEIDNAELFSEDELPAAIDAALAEAEDAIDASELVVTTEPAPTPLGRSWAFDFTTKRFVMAGHQPVETRRTQTLEYWIQKTLRTPLGGSVIHPPGYGFVKPTEIFGGPLDAADVSTLQEKVEDALLPHPSISAIEGFEAEPDPELEEALLMRFHVITDDQTVLPIEERVNP